MPFSQPPSIAAPPASFIQARSALNGLGALFNIADPCAWASLARPQTQDLAALVFSIGDRLDEGMADMGFTDAGAPDLTAPDRSPPPVR